jgi:hypothetical protein
MYGRREGLEYSFRGDAKAPAGNPSDSWLEASVCLWEDGT